MRQNGKIRYFLSRISWGKKREKNSFRGNFSRENEKIFSWANFRGKTAKIFLFAIFRDETGIFFFQQFLMGSNEKKIFKAVFQEKMRTNYFRGQFFEINRKKIFFFHIFSREYRILATFCHYFRSFENVFVLKYEMNHFLL